MTQLPTPARLERLAIALGEPRKPASPGELRKLLGCSRPALWRWRNGKSEPLVPYLRKIEEIEQKLHL